ncbi:glycosyltransferase family 4 protein [Phenylobacterium sp.]|uniref:glycosyltransferase family 4 protein n=1 Tax=Phenylobacterium sp. TaxID=1871053 RepID=UPI002ED7CE86
MTIPGPATAVIRSEPDGYDMAKTQLMGRQSAGHGFLRAAVDARGDRPIYGLTAQQRSARALQGMVHAIDPAARFEWIPAEQLTRVAEVGVLYIADATVAAHSRTRLRIGVGAYSICGVTHTTASHGVMDEMVGLLREAVAPWDALVCTSNSVVETVRRVHEAEADYARWRYGVEATPPPPQLPLIPLGVHCDDFQFSADDRAEARVALGLDPDEVVGLFVGRLVFHAKAHPLPIFKAMQAAADRTGKRVALIFSGWAPNEGVEQAYRGGAAAFAPDAKVIFVDGREAKDRKNAWAAADLFLSPSDNIQETFGLTPVEAMAAGLPVVVSDYDGYRDTVRADVDGFRVATWAPAAGNGQGLAHAYEAGWLNYDQYCWSACAATAVDPPAYSDAVTALVENADLRRRMGEAGRARAREVFDWRVVYAQYQALWSDLNARRQAAAASDEQRAWVQAAPLAAPARLDPFHAFGHYVTHALDGDTRLALTPGVVRQDLATALNHPLFGALPISRATVEAVFAALEGGTVALSSLPTPTRAKLPIVVRAAGLLVKMGLAAPVSR